MLKLINLLVTTSFQENCQNNSLATISVAFCKCNLDFMLTS